VPSDPRAYSEEQAVEDLYQLLKYLGIDSAFVGGLSMGGTAALHFGRTHPEMARALIVASAGTGATDPARFREQCEALAQRLESEGMPALVDYALGPTRMRLKQKDPAGWQVFAGLITQHSPQGSALTMRGVQAGRRPIFDYADELRALPMPVLILAGDEDEPCLDPALFLKRTIATSGLAVFPQSGHAINLEEPDLFNRTVLDFLTAVESDSWATRDDGTGFGFLAR
jgi:pimeloyl-ACP methyl ester carboxylesterase